MYGGFQGHTQLVTHDAERRQSVGQGSRQNPPRPKSTRKKIKQILALFFCSYVVSVWTLVGTGSRSTAFKGIFFLGGFYPDTVGQLYVSSLLQPGSSGCSQMAGAPGCLQTASHVAVCEGVASQHQAGRHLYGPFSQAWPCLHLQDDK